MAVYGNNTLNMYEQLITTVCEQNYILESIDSNIINEGAGEVLKRAWDAIIEGIKHVIKSIGKFITMVIGKVKSIFNKEKQEEKNQDKEDVQIKTDPNKETNQEAFENEKEKFLNMKLVDISDVVKINFVNGENDIANSNYSAFYWSLVCLNFSDTIGKEVTYIYNKNHEKIFLKDTINQSDLFTYEDLLELDNSSITVKDYIDKKYYISSHKKDIMSDLNVYKQELPKTEATFKYNQKVWEKIVKLCNEYSKVIDDDDEDKRLESQIFGLLKELLWYDEDNYLDNVRSDDGKIYLDNIIRFAKDMIKVSNNGIMILTRYIPLYMKVRRKYMYLDNYIRSRQITILKKYNVSKF